ncbi:MAG: Chemotaxis response regulator protein-glutamate methylesterase [Thermoanaerobaculia bacterium]|nr:Chemotaxis response regulator protein-glutamate methylesterase [Thermoanaerobaculia bacterium]
MSRRVLMVDDEEALVWATARQMAKARPDLAFEGLTSPGEALDRIRQSPPDLLITDVRMPGMSGLELLLEARTLAPRLPVIVITAYGTAELRAQIRSRASVEYLEKPFSFPSLFAAVDRALETTMGFAGSVVLPMLPDLIQMYALSRVTGALRITRGATLGGIWFDGGQISHATCGDLKGAQAVYQLLRWEGGNFRLEPGATAPERSVSESWQELLIEGCRLLDESRQGQEPETAADAFEAGPVSEPGSPDLDPEGIPVWLRLRPLITEFAPRALVVAARPGTGASRILMGDGDPALWGRALGGLVDRAIAFTGEAPHGVFECTWANVGIAVFWSAPARIALAVVDSADGHIGVSRFRSFVTRWWLASEQELSGPATGGER